MNTSDRCSGRTEYYECWLDVACVNYLLC